MSILSHIRWTWFVALAFSALALAACGDDDAAAPVSTTDEGIPPGSGSGAAESSDASSDATDETNEPTAPQQPEVPSFDGACPEMNAGTVQMTSGGLDRQFILTLPDEPTGAPVLFVYHGNGSNAPAFVQFFGAARIAEHYGTIVVTPSSSGLFQIEWPILGNDDKQVEAGFFLDVIACLHEQLGADLARVYTTGFSAGGLWSTWLTMHMADHLAASAIYSGGVSNFTSSYQSPSWTIPVLATHGGPTDEVAINFEQTTDALVAGLKDDGHLVVLCTHNGGHSIPWRIPDLMMPFLLAHSWQSPDLSFEDGLDSSWPDGCSVP